MSYEIISHKKKQQTLSLMTSLPDDVIVDIVAHVPRCNYPTLSLVSKHFHSLVTSSELYKRRTLLGSTEACIYVGIYNRDTNDCRLYILHQEANKNRLVLIQPLLHMPYHANYVAVGTSIYLLCGFSDLTWPSDVASCMDCRYHTIHPLPSMPRLMVGDFSDGEISVIGYCYEVRKSYVNIMVVFNTETQMWESEITKLDMELSHVSYGFVVMPNKMYLRNAHNSFVYKPKKNMWETDELVNSMEWKSGCVVDDVLYYYDCLEKKLKFYDTKHKCWGMVKAVEGLFSNLTSLWWSHTVNHEGNLVVLLSIKEEDSERIKVIWFVEIAIERREGGDIWGIVERWDVMFDGRVHLVKPLVVMV